MEILSDKIRQADENNPKGYYEYEKVKTLPQDNAWLLEENGKAVKIIAQLLQYLPPQGQYKIIFMERNLDEILISQEKMLMQNGKNATENTVLLKTAFIRQLRKIKERLAKQENISVLYIDFAELIATPRETSEKVNRFLALGLNVSAMAASVDPTLYRRRKAKFL